MDSSVSPKDEIWFLRVCHHISNAVYKSVHILFSSQHYADVFMKHVWNYKTGRRWHLCVINICIWHWSFPSSDFKFDCSDNCLKTELAIVITICWGVSLSPKRKSISLNIETIFTCFIFCFTTSTASNGDVVGIIWIVEILKGNFAANSRYFSCICPYALENNTKNSSPYKKCQSQNMKMEFVT